MREYKKNQKCIYCDSIVGHGSLGMCNKHYIQFYRYGDALHSEKKERAKVDGYYRDGRTGRREHRLIWEEYYGESLLEEEVIHHINFIKTDNDIKNLWKYPNASEHIKAHREYERLLLNLKENEEIIFLDGNYVKRERVTSDRQYGERSSLIITLCDLGVGGQKGIVYHAYGISPSLTATQYKDPEKIVVKNGK